jgi:hypothetical protein
MRHIQTGLISMLLLSGCTFNQYQDDIADNQYAEKQIHADADAAYVGEWTAATDVGMRSIKIMEDGKIKVCLASSAGTGEGKVYMDHGNPAIIMDTGAQVKIISKSKDFLLLEVYGNQEKYYAGPVPDACASAFTNFD